MTYKSESESEQYFSRSGKHSERIVAGGNRDAGLGKSAYSTDASLADLEGERDDLIARMSGVDEGINRLKAQIEAAQANFHATGKRTDPRWFASKKAALRDGGRDRQDLQNRLGAINKQIRKNNYETLTRSKERIFLDVAKEVLPEAVFNEIYERAYHEWDALIKGDR